MKKNISKFFKKCTCLLLSLVVGSFIHSCTGNPFSGNDIKTPKTQIQGKVELRDGGSSDGVYVWMQDYNISTRVDEAGEFRLALPPPESQGALSGVSGVFKLFFFLANYNLATADVVVQNGEIVYGRGEINSQGRLTPSKVLIRALRIHTAVSPATINKNYLGSVEVSLNTITNPMKVVFPNTIPGKLGAALFRNKDTGEVFTYRAYPDNNISEEVIIGAFEQKRSLKIDFLTFQLPAAKYEVIPYFLINRDDIPQDLLDSLGSDYISLGPNYLKMPIKRLGGILEVKE